MNVTEDAIARLLHRLPKDADGGGIGFWRQSVDRPPEFPGHEWGWRVSIEWWSDDGLHGAAGRGPSLVAAIDEAIAALP